MSAIMPDHFPGFLPDFLAYQQLHKNTILGSDGDPEEGEYQLILQPEDALMAAHQCKEALIASLEQKSCSEAEIEALAHLWSCPRIVGENAFMYLLQRLIKLPDGTITVCSLVVEKFGINRDAGSAVLVVLPNNRIRIGIESRFATFAKEGEIPRGMFDPCDTVYDEDPLTANRESNLKTMQREAEEEIGVEIREIIYCGKCTPDALLKSDNVAIGIATAASLTQQRLDEFENITSVDLSLFELLQGFYHGVPVEYDGTLFHLRDNYTAHALIHLLCSHKHLVGNIKTPQFPPKPLPAFDPSTYITSYPRTNDSMLRFQQLIQSRSDFPVLDKNQGHKQLEVDEQRVHEIIVDAQDYLIHQHHVDPVNAKKWASRDTLVCETKDFIFVHQPMSFFGRGGTECTALFRRIVRKDGIDVVLLPLLEMEDRMTRIFSRVFFSVAPDPICHKEENKLRQWHVGLPNAAFDCTRNTLDEFVSQILHQQVGAKPQDMHIQYLGACNKNSGDIGWRTHCFLIKGKAESAIVDSRTIEHQRGYFHTSMSVDEFITAFLLESFPIKIRGKQHQAWVRESTIPYSLLMAGMLQGSGINLDFAENSP